MDVIGLYLGIDLHEDGLYPVGHGVAGVVDVVEELDAVPGQDVVVVVRVGGVSPPQAEEHGQGRAQAEEVLNPEDES